MFVNRIKEQKRLIGAFNDPQTRLIVLYGRRRCGKSTLITEVLTPGSVYFAADLREAPLQLIAVSKQIAMQLPDFDKVIYPDWESLFLSLNRRTEKQLILCLDEFPYLVKNNPELPSVIQSILDTHKILNFKLILCGSSQQMMQGIALNSSSPLYGRCDEIMRIDAMGISDMASYFGSQVEDMVTEFSVWGGIPRYWEIRAKSKSFEEAVHYHLLDSYGVLYEEPERLFADEMRTAVQAFSVISVIANGSNRISEIAGKLGKPATQLSRLIGFLCDLGYIRREIPYGESLKSSKKSLYKINDPFLNFYFSFILPNKSRIEFQLGGDVWKDINSGLNQYVSHEWEEQCRRKVPFLLIKGKRFLPSSRWWGSGTDKKPMEIDIIAESTDRSTLLFAEVKWSDQNNLQQIENQLHLKVNHFPLLRNKTILMAAFIKSKPQNYTGNLELFDVNDIIS